MVQQSAVPRLVQFSGTLAHMAGRPVAGVTFALYNEQEGGAPIWQETQNVALDGRGHYSAMLGATVASGLPADLFASGQARWLGVQPEGAAEQPRVLLLSVPYALKAADAETVGGLPPSAFVMAAASGSRAATANTDPAAQPNSSTPALSGSGTLDFIPLWTPDGSTLGNSILFQNSSSEIGVGTQSPGAKLDVAGSGKFRGTLLLPATGTATATGGKNSQALNLAASAFSSSVSTAVNETFSLRAEPAGNNTATPSATLNLLFGSGTSTPTETGLNISSTGLLTFATGQTFPGTGTITGVTAGSGLTGGGSSGAVSLGLLTSCTANQVLQWNGSAWVCATVSTGGGTITGVTAGIDLTGGGTSGTVTLNVDTTKVAQLNSLNNGTLTVSGTNGGTIFQSTNNTGTSGAAVLGLSTGTTGVGVQGTGTTGVLGSGLGTVGIGVVGTGNQGVSGTGANGVIGTSNSSGIGYGVLGQTGTSQSATSASGVYGIANSTTGQTYGVQGFNLSNTNFAAAISGLADGDLNTTFGVVGSSASPNGIGVIGFGQNESNTGRSIIGCCAIGMWGDTNSSAPGAAGLVGTADDARAIYLQNNSPSGVPTAYMFQGATGKLALVAGGSTGACTVDTNGNLVCHGSKSAVVPVDSGQRQVALYAVEAPQNWFEDFGSGRLTSGAATIALEPVFAQTVNSESEYHIFLTPEGDCRGLYVSNKTAAGFEVHELAGGQSNVAFDYRIVALRRSYENVRLEDKTAMMAALKANTPTGTGERWMPPARPNTR